MVPIDAHRFGPLVGLQEPEVQGDGSLEGCGEGFSVSVDHHTHYRCVDDRTSGQSGDV